MTHIIFDTLMKKWSQMLWILEDYSWKFLGLEADIEQNTREEFKRFLVTLLHCEREEGIDAIDDDQAAEDAQELYDVRLK